LYLFSETDRPWHFEAELSANRIPTFPGDYGFIAAIEAAPVGIPLLPSCQVLIEEQGELQIL
jgi:hypothetical protein